MKPKNFSFLLRCLISVLLLGYIFSRVSWTETVSVLRGVNFLRLGAGSFLVLALVAGLAFRWRLFLNQQEIALPYREVFILTWAGQFFNSVLPGSTGGDVFKIYEICLRQPGRKMVAASTVIADRLSAVVSLLFLVLLGVILAPALFEMLWRSLDSWAIRPGFLILAGAGLLVFFGFLASDFWWGRIKRLLKVLKETVALKATFLKATGLSLAIHGISLLYFYIFAGALGISLSFLQALIILPVVFFVVLLPVTVNGHGLREVVLIFYFQQLHVGWSGSAGVTEMVVALSLVMVANDLLWCIVPCLWLLLREDRKVKNPA